jgi:hypothetical protein
VVPLHTSGEQQSPGSEQAELARAQQVWPAPVQLTPLSVQQIAPAVAQL